MKPKYIFILLIMLLFMGCKHLRPFNNWDQKDTAMLTTALGLTALDYRMTSNLVDRKDEGYYEKYNFILSENPSQGRVNTWFIGSAFTKTLVASLLPKNKTAWLGLGREFWLSWNIGISSDLIKENYKIGLEITF